MTPRPDARTCPQCGATNSLEAQWCGQCLKRFAAEGRELENQPPHDEPVIEPVIAPVIEPVHETVSAVKPDALHVVKNTGVHRVGDSLAWTCPACSTQNSIDDFACSICGTSMSSLFGAQPPQQLKRTGPTVAAFSAILPGAGHLYAGRIGEGVGRVFLFLWSALVGVFLVTRRLTRTGAVVHSIGTVFLIVAAAVWVIAFLEAQRLANGRVTTLIPSKALMWGMVGLTCVLFLGLAAGVRR